MLARDYYLLMKIQSFFKCGNITCNKNKNTYIYLVSNVNDIFNYILPHFLNYPLRGTNYLDYLDYSKIIHLLLENRTLDKNSLNIKNNNVKTILSIINNMNTNRVFNNEFITTHLENFPLNPHYISAFIEGESSLIVELTGLKKYRINISIDQHKNKFFLLESFKSLLKFSSSLVLNKKTNVLKLSKSGDKYFKTFLIPFFIEYPLHSHK